MKTKPEAPYPYDLLADITGEPWETELDADQMRGLEHALDTLSEREHNVMLTRYKEGLTLEDLGKRFGVTRERVRQICVKAVRKLAHPTRYKYITLGYERASGELREQVAARRAETIAMLERELDARMAQLRAMIANADELLGKLNGTSDTLTAAHELINTVDMPLAELDFSVRSYNCLARAGVKTISDITAMTDEQLKNVRNLGRKSYEEVIGKLAQYGLTPREAEE